MSRRFDDNYNRYDFYSNDLRSDSDKYNNRPSRYERYGDKNMIYNCSRDDQSKHSGFRDCSREDNSRFNHLHDNHQYIKYLS
ncbi:Hypothetical protein SRAE_2000071600 [Strongyloides ratti]|uniref:Uncharacterized protein n=1 Tax=Strongyloides ratti TaxID=34506 RepID=A0A090MXU5_STRRB|nr:Hypothetical protein SRAE_2000071600 [Strongyloides ratti]CEF66044.1 Hypothetical protein SRAE_2000071600 [Strongyloides ratti]